MVKAPAKSYDPQEVETRLLSKWKESRTFEKSVEQRRDANQPFIFLEGPPTMNGLPGIHHVLARTFKDLICRYKTMKGHVVERKGGWDTHGLPVETSVEKSLGLKSKKEIETFGVAKFNERCKESVFLYEKEWRAMTERMGYWVDLDNPYITLRNPYIESVWWSLKTAWNKGLFYKGFKVAPWCPRCGTTLSSHEVAQGYKDVEDPSIFIKFKAKGEDWYFLAWTTTPWTLLSNVALAVHPDFWYACVEHKGERFVLAEQLLPKVIKSDYKVLWRIQGCDMEGKSYEPLFDYINPEKKAWFVVLADFVTLDDGTGIVHTAPAFGEDDAKVGKDYDLPHVQPVDLEGKFTADVPPFAGKFVKDADPLIMEMLKQKGALVSSGKVSHSYPFCWRCDTPLLYYARDSWFIAMSRLSAQLLANNEEINWYPAHLKNGRFGDFIRGVKDWALSRERYWGTPLPIWTCGCGETVCLGSAAEIEALSGTKLQDYHKPHIDEVKVKCKACGAVMRREPYVIDVWYDSGASYFAQWHYPFENKERFGRSFPVDYISEAIDQTRGWFYTLLAISTFTHDSLCYRNCLCLGHVLDKEGQKMSKSKGNVVEPWSILNDQGADALRWYFCSMNAPWVPKRFDVEGLDAAYAKFPLTYWNSFSFYASYAHLDRFDPSKHTLPPERRTPLDRWLLSRLHRTIVMVDEYYSTYDPHKAARALEDFVVNDLSNWYIRRSRKRYWGEGLGEDKKAGYSTLHEALLAVAQLAAPMMPFMTDDIYLSMTDDKDAESIHLTDFPEAQKGLVDDMLEAAMAECISLAEAGRAIRAKAQIKNRQPLATATIVPVSQDVLQQARADAQQARVKEKGREKEKARKASKKAAKPLADGPDGTTEDEEEDAEGGEDGVSEASRPGVVPGLDAAERKAALEPLLPLLKDELNVKDISFTDDLGGFQERALKPNNRALGPKHKKAAGAVAKAIDALDMAKAVKDLDAGRLEVEVDGSKVAIAAGDVIVEHKPQEGTAIEMVGPLYLVMDLKVTDALKGEGWAREVIRRIQQMRKDMDLDIEDRISVTLSCPKDVAEMLVPWKDHVMNEVRATLMEMVAGGGDKGPAEGRAEGEGSILKEWDVDGTAITLLVSKVVG